MPIIVLCPTPSPARYEEANSTSLKSCKGMCVALEQVERNIFMKFIFYILEVVQYLQVCEAGCGLAWQCQKDNSCVSIHQGRSHSNAFKTWCQIVCTMRFQRVSKILTPRRMLQKTLLIA